MAFADAEVGLFVWEGSAKKAAEDGGDVAARDEKFWNWRNCNGPIIRMTLTETL